LENALKSKDNFKGKNQIKFIEIENNNSQSGTCAFHYKGQDFTLEWWNVDDNYMECDFACYQVETMDIDFSLDDFEYRLDCRAMENEEEIDNYIEEVVYAVKECYIAHNINKILKMAEKMSNELYELDGNEGDNKYMMMKALRHYDIIN
jgi:hypothetical protein